MVVGVLLKGLLFWGSLSSKAIVLQQWGQAIALGSCCVLVLNPGLHGTQVRSQATPTSTAAHACRTVGVGPDAREGGVCPLFLGPLRPDGAWQLAVVQAPPTGRQAPLGGHCRRGTFIRKPHPKRCAVGTLGHLSDGGHQTRVLLLEVRHHLQWEYTRVSQRSSSPLVVVVVVVSKMAATLHWVQKFLWCKWHPHPMVTLRSSGMVMLVVVARAHLWEWCRQHHWWGRSA